MARKSTPKPKRLITALHRRLKELRESAGLSQEDLATEIDIDKTSISHWELGIALPRPDRMVDIAKALRVPVQDLFDLYIEVKRAS